MTQKEKENRIHSFALEFLERQKIVPNLYADQIIKGYKEGYLQAEQDFEVKEIDFEKEIEKEWLNCDLCRENTILEYANMGIKKFRTIAKHFFELGLKAQKGE